MVEQAETAVANESTLSSGGPPPISENADVQTVAQGSPPTTPVSPETRSSADGAESYAEVVKHHNREATIPEENEPNSPIKSTSKRADEPNDDDDESATLLDKGKGKNLESPLPDTPTTNAQDDPVEQLRTPTRPSPTPTKSRPTSFPVMPRLASSTSQRSVQSSPSGTSTPSRSPSYPNLAQSTSNSSQGHGQGTPQSQGQVTPQDAKGGKTRKRLDSIKKMVRRISDQGGGLVRSNSTGRPGSRGGGLASPEVNAGDDQKKRLSMNQSKGNQGGE